MPLNLIKDLDKKASTLVPSFRVTLADAPLPLDRAETALRMFYSLRAKIMDGASDVLELKGYIAGILHTKSFTRQRQDAVRKALKDEEISPEVGKPAIAELAAAAQLSARFATDKQEELSRAGGKLEGYYYAAQDALEEIKLAIAHHLSTAAVGEDDEDWSGRGTENGQRAVGGNGSGNGKKAPRKRAPRKPRTKKSKQPEEKPEG